MIGNINPEPTEPVRIHLDRLGGGLTIEPVETGLAVRFRLKSPFLIRDPRKIDFWFIFAGHRPAVRVIGKLTIVEQHGAIGTNGDVEIIEGTIAIDTLEFIHR